MATAEALAAVGASVMRLAALRTLQYLETSRGWSKVALREGEFHPGDTPVDADYDAHDRFSRVILSHPASAELNIRSVVGEENLNIEELDLRPNSRVIVLDPIDGSSQWMMIRTGHCVSALILAVNSDRELVVESAVVVNPVHAFSFYNSQVWMGAANGKAEGDIALTSCLPDTLDQPSFGITGFKARDRGSFSALITELPGWSCLSIGGNPVTPYVFAGSLTAAVTWRAQYSWDAVGILMATYTDAVVGHLDGQIVRPSEFRSFFKVIGLTRNAKVIPPIIVAKNKEAFEELVGAVERAKKKFGEKFGTGVEF